MLAGVSEAAKLLRVVRLQPIELAARGADVKGGMQVDEHMGLGETLPHARNIGMLLRDMTAFVATRLEGLDQRGFARATGADDPDEEGVVCGLASGFGTIHRSADLPTGSAGLRA